MFNAFNYISSLTKRNRLARSLGFTVGRCSGLEGLYDLLASASSQPNFISVDDSSEGYIDPYHNPASRTVKTVYMAMRHAPGDMAAREYALSQMREIFRQFMTAIIPERVRLEEEGMYIDPRIQYNEIESYFCTGAAAAFFQLAIDTPTELCFNPDEWTDGSDDNL